MDWQLALSLIVWPLALASQLRTRTVNVPALLTTPVVYGVLTVRALEAAPRVALGLRTPAILAAGGLVLGFAQGHYTRVFFDTGRSAYRQRGGAWPLVFWAAALLLRQGAAHWLSAGLLGSAGRLVAMVTMDAVVFGLLAGRALALLLRHPELWAAGASQLRGEPLAPPAHNPGGSVP